MSNSKKNKFSLEQENYKGMFYDFNIVNEYFKLEHNKLNNGDTIIIKKILKNKTKYEKFIYNSMNNTWNFIGVVGIDLSNNKQNFTKEDLQNIEIAFDHLKEDHKCDEVIISTNEDFKIITPIKILEKVTSKIKDEYGSYKGKDILGEHFFDYFFKKKKVQSLKNKEIESIDISKNFIRFNFKEE